MGQRRERSDVVGHDVGYTFPPLQAPTEKQQRNALQHSTMVPIHIRSDDHIHQSLLILQSEEHESLGCGGSLANHCQSRDLHPGPIGFMDQLSAGDHPLSLQPGPVEGQGVIVRGKPQQFILLHQFLSSTEDRKADIVRGQCQV